MPDVTIQTLKNGPLLVKGKVQLADSEGKSMPGSTEQIALCRCGHSANKPFCDGSHKKVGFQA